MDINDSGQITSITGTVNDEVRVNATSVQVRVTEFGRLLGGFVFNTGGSTLAIDDGGVVQRGAGNFDTAEQAITGSSGADTVTNNGSINGMVSLGDGADSFTTTTGISHLLDLGAGDDTLTVNGAGLSQLYVAAGGGYDRLVLNNTGFGSAIFQFNGFEDLTLNGAAGLNDINGTRITSLWNMNGLQSLKVIGDAPTVQGLNGPQFYVRNSAMPDADIVLQGRASLFLDSSTARSVMGDESNNHLSLYPAGAITGAINLAGGDDGFSVEWANSPGQFLMPAQLLGGAGADLLSFYLRTGGTATLDFANVSGFETVWLDTALNTAAAFNVSNLSDQTYLRITRPVTLDITASMAESLVVGEFQGILNLAAGSTIGGYGPIGNSYANPNANPAVSVTFSNAGAVLGAINFGQGDDTYNGTAGVVGGIVDGAAGNDTLLGGAGAETFRGGRGADRLEGNAGNDALLGDAGSDTLLGGDGDDQLFGGEGGDFLDGGAGFDFASHVEASSGVLADLVVWTLNTGEAAGDSYAGLEGLIGTAFDDSLRGTGGDNWIYGGAGNDIAFGRGGNDVLIGEGGNDALIGNEGNDALYGGAGADYLTGAEGADLLVGDEGLDFALYEGAASGIIADLVVWSNNSGDAAGDSYFGIEGVSGSGFNDSLRGDASANILYGNDGDDYLFGRGGNDTLVGGNGSDTLFGNEGTDLIFTGAGNDRVLFGVGDGNDFIADMQVGSGTGDVIQLSTALGVNSFGQLQAKMAQLGNDTVITFNAGTTITLVGIALGTLAADDFAFT